MLANPGVALTWWDEAAWAERFRLEAAHDLNHLRQIDRLLGACI